MTGHTTQSGSMDESASQEPRYPKVPQVNEDNIMYEPEEERGDDSTAGTSDDDGSTEYESADEPSPRIPRHHPASPEPDCTPAQMITRHKSGGRLTVYTKTPQASECVPTTTPQKRKRGERSVNKAEGIYDVHSIDSDGEPDLPKGIHAKWRNCCGRIAREKCDITWQDWRNVDAKHKDYLWAKLQAHIRYPKDCDLEKVKNASIQAFGRALRNFKARLVVNYVRTNRTPFKKFRNISAETWKEFVNQKNTEKFLAQSAALNELNQRNKYKHRLGPGGYKRQIPEWRRKEEEDRLAERPNPVLGYEERTRNWIYARSQITDDGCIVAKPDTVEVINKVEQIAQQKMTGQFKSVRQNDELTKALGNKEHTGRTRAISSKTNWSVGFKNVGDSNKHDRCKKDLTEQQVKEICAQTFYQFMADNLQYRAPMQAPVNYTCSKDQPHSVNFHSSSAASSSAFAPEQAAFASKQAERFPVDDIIVDTPCDLYMPFGRMLKLVMVATGRAIPGRTFHNRDIPTDYAKVEIKHVVERYLNDDLEVQDPDEGILTLEDAIGNFVLWQRRDIILAPPPNQRSPLSANISLANEATKLSHLSSKDGANAGHFGPPPSSQGRKPSPTHQTSLPPSTHQPSTPLTRQLSPAPFCQLSPPPRQPSPTHQPSPSSSSVPQIIGSNEEVNRYVSFIKNSSIPQQQDMKKPEIEKCRKLVIYDGWELAGDDWPKYKEGKPLLPLQQLVLLPVMMQKFHEWYIDATQRGISHISAWVHGEVFNCRPFKLTLLFEEFHRMYRLARLDITMIQLWCLLKYTSDVQKQVAYLNPAMISQSAINPSIDTESKMYKDMTPEQLKEAKAQKTIQARSEVATYIGHCMEKWKNKKYIMAPYNFDDHWICIMLIPRNSYLVVFDSGDKDRKAYDDFISVVNCAFRWYTKRRGAIFNAERTDKMYFDHKFPCNKQRRPGSVHCGYYTCMYMGASRKYLKQITEKPKKDPRKIPPCEGSSFTDEQLFEGMVNPTCQFTLHHVIYPEGDFYDPSGTFGRSV